MVTFRLSILLLVSADARVTSKLESGATIQSDELPIATSEATVFYSDSFKDNVVAAIGPTARSAQAHGSSAYPQSMFFYATASEANEAANIFGITGGALALKTFWSASLNDTLVTASTVGLAWGSDSRHGYVFQRIEGYCLASQPFSSKPSSLFKVFKFEQTWSEARNDSFLVSAGGEHEEGAFAVGYKTAWTECYVLASTIPGATGKWTPWANVPQKGIPWPKSKDLLGWEYLSGANPGYGGGTHIARSADTWYTSWAADNLLYTSFTDGRVKDDTTGKWWTSFSGGRAPSYSSATGQAIIVGDDPFDLNITRVKSFAASTFPYQGRYPCGQLVYKGNWWYGTYYLDNPNASVGGNYVGPNPGPDCGNWCIQGPLADFRLSTDKGETWKEFRHNATSGSDNLFGETAANNQRVKFGAPHWVDFGQELKHSPDGKAYLVGHGASTPSSIQAWMLGDEIYLARVTPTPDAIADRNQWEFYAGGHGADATWAAGDVSKAQPLVAWDNHTGVVTMTYMPALKKYMLVISTASFYPSMTKQFDTYFLESDSITGPWAYVNYNSRFGPEAYFVHHPSKFLAERANTSARVYDSFIMYSANFAFRDGSMPPNSGYHMNLQQARFPISADFARRLEARYNLEDEMLHNERLFV